MVAVVLLALALALIARWRRNRRRRGHPPDAMRAPAEHPEDFIAACVALADTLRSDTLARRLRDAAARDGDAAERRRLLVATLIQIGDLVDDTELAALRATLERAGVEVIDVAHGAAFDPAVHLAIDVAATGDPQLDGLVAGSVRPGYRDGRTLLREPEVTVYRVT